MHESETLFGVQVNQPRRVFICVSVKLLMSSSSSFIFIFSLPTGSNIKNYCKFRVANKCYRKKTRRTLERSVTDATWFKYMHKTCPTFSDRLSYTVVWLKFFY